jgi:ribosomal protein S18 acetylase RimI-like enzyme
MLTQKVAISLVSSQVRPAAAVMARAFFDDPFFTFVFPNLDRRRSILPWIFEKTIAYGLHSGLVLTTPALEGVAMWLGPDKTSLTGMEALLSGLFLLPIKLSFRELKNSLRLNRSAERLHTQAVTGRHWYLVDLGVEPALQGQGVAGALLQPVLASADRESLPCYLETNNAANLPFYEHYGFTVAGLAQAWQNGPHTWAMCREPAWHPVQ